MSSFGPSIPHDARRKLPRHPTSEGVSCGLGEVIDLSGTGMQVAVKRRCSMKVGQAVPMRIKTVSGSIPVMARVVWRRRAGLLGGCVLGLHFDGVSAGQCVALATIARFGFLTQQNMQAVSRETGVHVTNGKATDQSKPSQHIHSTPELVEATIVMAEYFERLGLGGDASPAQVKDAYRKLARQYHPDVAPGAENQRKFLELREAYDLLCDHQRRAG